MQVDLKGSQRNEININAPNIYSGNSDELTSIDFLKKFFKTNIGQTIISFTVVRFILGFIEKILSDSISQNAAQMAYYFLFAMLPMMIFLLGVVQLLPIPEDKVIEFFTAIAPEDVSNFLENFVTTTISDPQIVLLSFGFIAAIWSASTGVNAILFSINEAYGIRNNDSYFKRKSKSIFLAIGMIASLAGSLLIIVYGRQIGELIRDTLGISIEVAVPGLAFSWATIISVLFVVFVTLYWIGPAKKTKIIYVLPGAILASLGWIISSLIFSYYADHFANYASTYGSIAGIMILMIWFYLTGIILTIGGCFNAFFEHTIQMKRESRNKN